MTKDEFIAHIQQHSLRDFLMIRILQETGWKMSYLLDLQRDGVGAKQLKSMDQIATISSELIGEIKSYIKLQPGEGLLFKTNKGGQIGRNQLNQTVNYLNKKLATKFTVKTLTTQTETA